MIVTKNRLLIDKIRMQCLQEKLYVPDWDAYKIFKKNEVVASAQIRTIAFEPKVGWALSLKWPNNYYGTNTVAVYVAPTYRRQKYATKLLDAVTKIDPIHRYGYGSHEGELFFKKYFGS